MRPKFLLDECVEAVLLDLIVKHNQTGAARVEAIRVGDRADLPLGTADPELLRWAEKNGYIIVTRDVSTLRTHFGKHLVRGDTVPECFCCARHRIFMRWWSFWQWRVKQMIRRHGGI